MVWLALAPPAAPVEVVQLDAAPEIFQVTLPAGAVAPTIPLTVAVKVIFPPKTGEAGDEVTAIVGVAGVTVTVTALAVADE